jgi:chaperonin cofactor prefoldin
MEIQQLQTSLQKEIDAKQHVQEELNECQAENILKAEYG